MSLFMGSKHDKKGLNLFLGIARVLYASSYSVVTSMSKKEDDFNKYLRSKAAKPTPGVYDNLLALGPEWNEARRSKIYYEEKDKRMYPFEVRPFFSLEESMKKKANILLRLNARKLGKIIKRISEESKCNAFPVGKKRE